MCRKESVLQRSTPRQTEQGFRGDMDERVGKETSGASARGKDNLKAAFSER